MVGQQKISNCGLNAKGFTALELLVTVSILGILLVVGATSFQSFLRDHRLIAVSEALYDDLHLAQKVAIRNRANIYVSIQSGASWCYGITDLASCDCSGTPVCTLGGVQHVVNSTTYSGFTLATTNLASNSLTFEGIRGTQNTGGSTMTFTSNASSSSITIKLNDMGYTKICSDTVRGYSACS